MPWAIVVRGRAHGQRVVTGPGQRVASVTDLPGVRHGAIVVVARPMNDLVMVLERIEGIVAESGGLLCHPSVVALECGVSYLATEGRVVRFADGQILRLDPFEQHLSLLLGSDP